ncbi:EamA family transporter [Marimonas sp. MJW-29]|uniref:EamA family transporter n=1 Tax=Sulfitobacter sediminis TaxID=3234186 RepID=A0ABV3RQI3_9RHOB
MELMGKMALSVLFSLVAAIAFSLSLHVQRHAVRHLEDLAGTLVSVATMAAMFWLVAGWGFRRDFWTSEAVIFFVIAGIFFPATAQRLQISATKNVGPALTSAFGAFLPLFAAAPAVVFLGEPVTLQQALGIALLMGALFAAAAARGLNWRNRAFYVLLLPLFAALARALGMPLAKAGYNYLAEPMFAMTVMSTVSVLVIFLMVVGSGTLGRVVNLSVGHRLFVLNGILVGLGFALVQQSLAIGSVTITTSIVATVPVWTSLMGALVFKNETLKWWHGAIAIVVCAGAILIVTGAGMH